MLVFIFFDMIKKFKILGLLLIGFLTVNIFSITNANAEEKRGEGKWMFRTRFVNVKPKSPIKLVADIPSAEGDEEVFLKLKKSNTIEFDTTYFFSKTLATELSILKSKNNVNLSGLDLGSLSLMPVTLTFQYHFVDLGKFKPYFGLGLNYTRFSYNKNKGYELVTMEYKNDFGYALQLGFDYKMSYNFGFNFDIKQIYLKTKPSIKADNYDENNQFQEGEKFYLNKININPLMIAVGFYYRVN